MYKMLAFVRICAFLCDIKIISKVDEYENE